MGELERLLAATGRPRAVGAALPGKSERDLLLLAVMAYAGLRRSELLGLDWDDLDLSRRLLRVRKAKGGRQRTIPIHPALAPLIVDYYATRVPLTEQALFVGVRKPGQEYVDDASVATFTGPLEKVDESQQDGNQLGDELTADAVVLAPGAVILPVAIYK